MLLKARDTIHVSSVSSDNIITGQTFEIDALAGASLIKRGLATEVVAATVKSEPAALSKSETAPKTKQQETPNVLTKSAANIANKAG